MGIFQERHLYAMEIILNFETVVRKHRQGRKRTLTKGQYLVITARRKRKSNARHVSSEFAITTEIAVL